MDSDAKFLIEVVATDAMADVADLIEHIEEYGDEQLKPYAEKLRKIKQELDDVSFEILKFTV